MWKLLILTLLCFKSLDISSAQQDESEGSSEQPMMRSQSAKDDEESPESRPNKIEHPSENAKESDMAKKQHNSEKDDIIPPSDQKSPAVRSRNGNIEKNTTTAKNTSKKTTPEDSNAISKKNAPTGSLDAASAKNLTTGGLGAFMMKNAVTAGLDAASAKNLTTGPSGAPLMKNAATGGAPLMKNAATGGAPLMKNAATQSSPSTTRSPTTPTRTSSSTTRSPSLTTRSPSLTTRSPSSTTQSPGATSSQNKPTGSPETPSTPTGQSIAELPPKVSDVDFIVSIVFNSREIKHFCTGVLIKPLYVLCAAHCLFFRDKALKIPLMYLTVKAKSKTLNDPAAPFVGVLAVTTHGEFNPDTPSSAGNIALIKLKEGFADITPAIIGDLDQSQITQVTYHGYGSRTLGVVPDTGKLGAWTGYAIPPGLCKNMIRSVIEDLKGFICILQYPKHRTCTGGPLLLPDNSVVGIATLHIDCNGNWPVVYIDIKEYVKWINNIVKY